MGEKALVYKDSYLNCGRNVSKSQNEHNWRLQKCGTFFQKPA